MLVSGRLGTIYGHQRTLLAGALIFTIFSLANAWSADYVSFVAMRALSGVGGGILMPNCVAVITLMVPPGRWRNVALGCFGASAPVGGFFGALFAAVFTEATTDWKWLFIFLWVCFFPADVSCRMGVLTLGSAILEGGSVAGLFFSMPKDQPLDKDGKIDYIGSAMGLSSLILFSVVWK